MMSSPVPDDLEDSEFPGVYWVRAYWILHSLKDGQQMPRHQVLPARAFGKRCEATRVFAVTHPWLGKYQSDPEGIQVEVLRSKFDKMFKSLQLDKKDVVFFDYLSLPQVKDTTSSGADEPSMIDDRTAEERDRFTKALSGDTMGRIFLTSRVIIIDEVPEIVQSNIPYIDRGWCYFELLVATLNTFARDIDWLQPRTKNEIAKFREMGSKFRETGELQVLLNEFSNEMSTKKFAYQSDDQLVRGIFVSLARSQRLIRAAATGDWKGCESALDLKVDPCSRDGMGRSALHAALQNVDNCKRVSIVASLLRSIADAGEQTGDQTVLRTTLEMKTMNNETCLELAKDGDSRESEVLLRHHTDVVLQQEGGKSKYPEIIIRTLENDVDSVKELISKDSSGVAVNITDDQGYTAIFYSIGLKYVEMTAVLLESGANLEIESQGETGRQLAERIGFKIG